MRLRTQEMSCQAWERKPSSPITGKRWTCLQGASALRCQDQGVAQAQLRAWLCLYWFIFLSLGLLIWKMGTMIPISRMPLRLVPKEDKHSHSVYTASTRPAAQGRCREQYGRARFRLREKEGPQMRGPVSASPQLPTGPQPLEDHRSSSFRQENGCNHSTSQIHLLVYPCKDHL